MPSAEPPVETTSSSSPPAGTNRPPLPKLFTYTSPPPTLYYQGAEALLYRTTFLFPGPTTSSQPQTPNQPSENASARTPIHAALKHRPSKPYRHPALDLKLTRHRILAEARVLAKLRREGVGVPALLALDWSVSPDETGAAGGGGWMLMEWIEGETVRAVLDRELEAYVARADGQGQGQEGGQEEGLVRLMGVIGRLVGRVHELGVVHGDLTTSNLMVRFEKRDAQEQEQGVSSDAEVVLVDFGLSAQSSAEEDRAVDLYVLERAFGSTHPRTEGLFGEVLKAYAASYKGAKVALKRLEEVRMRGRKKIMIG